MTKIPPSVCIYQQCAANLDLDSAKLLATALVSALAVSIIAIRFCMVWHEDDEVEEFYEEVSKIMSENKSYYKIMIGDFNAKLGGHQQGDGWTVRICRKKRERDKTSSICNI